MKKETKMVCQAKPGKLDVSRPSKALLGEAYVLAKEVWEKTPWELMDERQVLAVHFADGRKGVMSVMGVMGTHRAIALYPSFAAYVRIRSIDEHDDQSALDAFFSVNQLQLSFGGLHGVLKSLTEARFKGTEFMPHNPCDSAHEVFGMIQSRMMG